MSQLDGSFDFLVTFGYEGSYTGRIILELGSRVLGQIMSVDIEAQVAAHAIVRSIIDDLFTVQSLFVEHQELEREVVQKTKIVEEGVIGVELLEIKVASLFFDFVVGQKGVRGFDFVQNRHQVWVMSRAVEKERVVLVDIAVDQVSGAIAPSGRARFDLAENRFEVVGGFGKSFKAL